MQSDLTLGGVVPPKLCLTRLARLVSLVSLDLRNQVQHPASSVIDCLITQLQSLSFISPHGCASIDPNTCSNIPVCLPNLRYLKVCDSAFSSVLYTLLNLPVLRELVFVLRASNSKGYAPVTLISDRPSELRRLSICGPHALVTLFIKSQAVALVMVSKS